MKIRRRFNFIFSSKSKNQASYKFGFLRALIENLYNVDAGLRLSYDQIYDTFSRVYWNLVVKHGLKQSNPSPRQSAVERILLDIQDKYQIPSEIIFDRLEASIQLELMLKIKADCKKNVVGALYGDGDGLLYEFSNKQEYLRFNPVVYRYLQNYQLEIWRLTNYEWAKFLERNNAVPMGFITALEGITQRSNLDYYLNILQEIECNRCFYCNKPFKQERPHVDHFVPWSYVHSDNLWNFVLACPSCNLSKNDKISGEPFLERVMERNSRLIGLTDPVIGRELGTYSERKMVELVRYAKRNGFEGGWAPRRAG